MQETRVVVEEFRALNSIHSDDACVEITSVRDDFISDARSHGKDLLL